MNTTYIFRSFKIIGFIFVLFFLSSCKEDHHNYHYKIQNTAENTGKIRLTYTLNDEPEAFEKWLEPNEIFEIYLRKNVTGDDIWNIETSSSLYVVPSLIATNEGETKMTEDLSIRSYWPANPTKEGENGVYFLQITDDLFMLEKQESYSYLIHNGLTDTLFATSHLHGSERRKDTVVAGETINIGHVEIYTYNENLKGTDKYIEKKLSGISSLTLKHEENTQNVNLKNYKLLNLQIKEQECILTVDNSIFN